MSSQWQVLRIKAPPSPSTGNAQGVQFLAAIVNVLTGGVFVTNMDSGKWIRELREALSVKTTDIERFSRAIADVKGNQDFYVSHATLADVETGSVPSIHTLFSLAACLKVSLEDLLLVFGIEISEVREFVGQGEPRPRGTTAVDPPETGFRFQLNFDAHFSSPETILLGLTPQGMAALPLALRNRLDPRHYRYAVVGLKDETMGELIPPGSLVEVDVMQNTVQTLVWRNMRERPVYLVWYTDGFVCCWCQLEGKDLTLLPYPLSRQPVRRFKVPREASIIGRVVNAWLPFVHDQHLTRASSSQEANESGDHERRPARRFGDP